LKKLNKILLRWKTAKDSEEKEQIKKLKQLLAYDDEEDVPKKNKDISVKSLFLGIALFIFTSSSFADVGYVGEDDKIEIDVNRIYTQPAKFPRKALRLAKDGYVLIEFDIDTDGSVIDPYVVESEPAGLFERAAMKSIRKWLYEPPVYEGVSVKVNDVQVKLTFKVQ
jgi:TonB family protein